MATVLQEFVQLLVGGIVDLGTGIAEGISNMAQALFLKVSDAGAVTGLSIFGGVCAIFAGVSLAVGLTTRIFTWVTSLGN